MDTEEVARKGVQGGRKGEAAREDRARKADRKLLRACSLTIIPRLAVCEGTQ